MLADKLKNYKVILASGSPRRQQFLKDLNVPFEIRLAKIEEIYPSHLKEEQITDYLANLKANAFNNLTNNDLLITSDTIVWLDGQALGKPKDKKEAFKMISALSGKAHKVITSVSLKTKSLQKIFNDTTIVKFKDLTEDEINFYIDNFKPYDKAGAYGIQEWIGFIGIEKIEGSYFNVVGLPVHKLYKELMEL